MCVYIYNLDVALVCDCWKKNKKKSNTIYNNNPKYYF